MEFLVCSICSLSYYEFITSQFCYLTYFVMRSSYFHGVNCQFAVFACLRCDNPILFFLVVYLVNVFGKWLTRVMLLASILLFLFLTVTVLLCYPLTFSGSAVPAFLFCMPFMASIRKYYCLLPTAFFLSSVCQSTDRKLFRWFSLRV